MENESTQKKLDEIVTISFIFGQHLNSSYDSIYKIKEGELKDKELLKKKITSEFLGRLEGESPEKMGICQLINWGKHNGEKVSADVLFELMPNEIERQINKISNKEKLEKEEKELGYDYSGKFVVSLLGRKKDGVSYCVSFSLDYVDYENMAGSELKETLKMHLKKLCENAIFTLQKEAKLCMIIFFDLHDFQDVKKIEDITCDSFLDLVITKMIKVMNKDNQLTN